MIDGTYQTSIKTPLGEKKTTITIATKGALATIIVNVAGIAKRTMQGVVEDNTVAAQGTVKIPFMGTLDLVIDGRVDGDVLSADIMTTKGTKHITAQRV